MKKITFLFITTLLLSYFSLSAQLLYKVEGATLEKPSFIFGTHHLAPVAMLDTISGLSDALSQCEAMVGEIDMTGSQVAMALQMQPYMTAPMDSTLSKLFTPKQFEDLNEKFEKINPVPGINLYALDGMKPMVVTNMVTLAIFQRTMPDFDPSRQLDSFFQEEGKSRGMKIIGLETPQQQAEIIFCTQPLSVQAESLVELLDNPDEAAKATEGMNQAYLRGDLATLEEESFKEEDSPEFAEALITRRNTAWAEKLPQIFNVQPTFVAVGALHLPGEKGLLQLLRDKGLTVSAITK